MFVWYISEYMAFRYIRPCYLLDTHTIVNNCCDLLFIPFFDPYNNQTHYYEKSFYCSPRWYCCFFPLQAQLQVLKVGINLANQSSDVEGYESQSAWASFLEYRCA